MGPAKLTNKQYRIPIAERNHRGKYNTEDEATKNKLVGAFMELRRIYYTNHIAIGMETEWKQKNRQVAGGSRRRFKKSRG